MSKAKIRGPALTEILYKVHETESQMCFLINIDLQISKQLFKKLNNISNFPAL